jgi:hypothetical protein
MNKIEGLADRVSPIFCEIVYRLGAEPGRE